MEKEQLISKMEEERDKLLGNTEKLRKDMDDRRKSRALQHNTLESSVESYKERIEVLKRESDENMKEMSLLQQELLETKSKAEDERMRAEEALEAKTQELERMVKLKSDLDEKIGILEQRITNYEVETTKMTSSNMR